MWCFVFFVHDSFRFVPFCFRFISFRSVCLLIPLFPLISFHYDSVLARFILLPFFSFHFVLLCFVRVVSSCFLNIRFFLVSFRFIPFRFALFCFVLLSFIPLHFVSFPFVSLHSVSFPCVLFCFSFVLLHFLSFRSVFFCFVMRLCRWRFESMWEEQVVLRTFWQCW